METLAYTGGLEEDCAELDSSKRVLFVALREQAGLHTSSPRVSELVKLIIIFTGTISAKMLRDLLLACVAMGIMMVGCVCACVCVCDKQERVLLLFVRSRDFESGLL